MTLPLLFDDDEQTTGGELPPLFSPQDSLPPLFDDQPAQAATPAQPAGETWAEKKSRIGEHLRTAGDFVRQAGSMFTAKGQQETAANPNTAGGIGVLDSQLAGMPFAPVESPVDTAPAANQGGGVPLFLSKAQTRFIKPVQETMIGGAVGKAAKIGTAIGSGIGAAGGQVARIAAREGEVPIDLATGANVAAAGLTSAIPMKYAQGLAATGAPLGRQIFRNAAVDAAATGAFTATDLAQQGGSMDDPAFWGTVGKSAAIGAGISAPSTAVGYRAGKPMFKKAGTGDADPVVMESPVAPQVPVERRGIRAVAGDVLQKITDKVDPSKAEKRQAAESGEFRDFLTGMPNRGAIDNALKNNPNKHILVLDGKNLKAWNDLVSSEAGDEYLINIGRSTTKSAVEHGATDRDAGRIGGDEFAVIHDDPEVLRAIGERISAMVGDSPIGDTGYTSGIRYGIGKTIAEANAQVKAAKEAEGKVGKYRDLTATKADPKPIDQPMPTEAAPVAPDFDALGRELGGNSHMSPQFSDVIKTYHFKGPRAGREHLNSIASNDPKIGELDIDPEEIELYVNEMDAWIQKRVPSQPHTTRAAKPQTFREFAEAKGRWPIKATDPDYPILLKEYEGQKQPKTRPAATMRAPKPFMKRAEAGAGGSGVPPTEPPAGKTAAGAGDEPDDKMAGSMNLNRFAGEDTALREGLRSDYEANQAAVDAARGPTVTHKEVAAAAKGIDIPVERIRSLKKGESLTPEETIALDNKMLALRKRAIETGSDEDLALYNEYNVASQKVARSQGQQLSARNIQRWEQMTPKEKAIERIADVYGDEGVPKDVLDSVRNAEDSDEAVADVLHNAIIKQKGWLHGYLYGNMLSSPATQLLNTVSNITTLASKLASRQVQAGLDVPITAGQRIFKKDASRDVFANEPKAYAEAAFTTGIQQGAKNFMFAFRHGFRKSNLEEMVDTGHGVPGGLKNPINWGPRLLLASDELVQSIAANGELAALATRKAMKDGLKGEELSKRIAGYMQDAELINQAAEKAKYVTHTQDMPKFMDYINQAINATSEKTPFFGSSLAPGKLVLPFVRIAFNVARAQINHSPFGLLRLLPSKLSYKGFTKEKATRVIAEAAIGSAPLLYLIPYAQSGNITGGIPKESGERETFYGADSGRKPYSVKIGNRWHDWRLFGPLAMPFAISAAWNDTMTKKGKKPDANTAMMVAGHLGKYMTDASFLAGLNSLSDALTDPEHNVARFVGNIAGQGVPMSSFLRFSNNYIDEYSREAESVYDRVVNGIPLLSETLPQRRNAMGQDAKRRPLFSKSETDPVYAEYERLGVNPTVPSRTVRVDDENVRLSLAEYSDLKKRTGEPVRRDVIKKMGSAGYQRGNDQIKADAIKDQEEKSRKGPRRLFINDLRTSRGL